MNNRQQSLKTKSLQIFGASFLSQFLQVIIYFLLIKIYTSVLSIEEFGLFQLLLIAPALITPFIFWEGLSGFTRFYNEFKNERGLYFSHIFVWSMSLTFFLSALTVFNHYFNFEKLTELKFKWFILSLLILFFSYIHNLNQNYFKLNYKNKNIIVSNFCFQILKLLFVILGVFYIEKSLYIILLGLMLGSAFTSLLFAIPIILNEGGFKLNLKIIKKSFHFSKWLIPGSYSGVLIQSVDRFMLQHMVNLNAVGMYSFAYRLGDSIKQFFTQPFNSLLLPIKFSHIPENELKIKLNTLFQLYLLIGFSLVLGINSFTPIVVQLLGGTEYLNGLTIIPVILVSHLFSGMNDFFNTGYLIKNKTQYSTYTLIVAALTNVILNVFLVPRYQAIGAAFSTFVSICITLPMVYQYSKSISTLSFSLRKKSFIIILFLFFISLQTYGLHIYQSTPHINTLISNFVIFVIYLFTHYTLLPPKTKYILKTTLKEKWPRS